MTYSYFFINEVLDTSSLCYDVFVSAYDGCERTEATYNCVSSKTKKWIVFPQYSASSNGLPETYVTSDYLDESSFMLDIFDKLEVAPGKNICVDCTGFLIPHLVFFIQLLKRKGINKFNILYSEPDSYLNAENTNFTSSENETRPIAGYSSVESKVNGDEVLFMFAGFNDKLITNVARAKSKAYQKYLIVGFPSLQADMYQQNLIQVNKAKETIGQTNVVYLKSPAYDPFVAAQKIQDYISQEMKKNPNISVFHIAPLSTKPMAIASALLYLYNPDIPMDVIYPTSDIYLSGHAVGIKRTWEYVIEFDGNKL